MYLKAMRSYLLLSCFLLIFTANARGADTVLISKPYIDTVLCQGGTWNVSYTVNTAFDIGNTFTVQISDGTGSFATATNIGTKTATTSGTISCTLPVSAAGPGYHIRIVASSPAFTSPDDGKDINVITSLNTPTINTNSPICKGTTLSLGISDSTPGLKFSWTGPGSFTSSLKNPTISSATTAATGMYYVTVSHTGCTSVSDSLSIYINAPTTPSITISADPGDTICSGMDISFISSITYGGADPTYQWIDNSSEVIGATGDIWGSHYLTDGDVIYCILKSDATCVTKTIDTSNKIVVTILPSVSPSVNITADPGTSISPGETITFTASVANPGTLISYQWQKNDTNIAGANSATYKTSLLKDGDEITVFVTTNTVCAPTDTALSNGLTMTISTSVPSINNNNNIALYPNPNNGSFIIKGSGFNNGEINFQVLNVIGQVVYSDALVMQNGTLNKQIELPQNIANGLYLMRIENGNETNTIHFAVQR